MCLSGFLPLLKRAAVVPVSIVKTALVLAHRSEVVVNVCEPICWKLRAILKPIQRQLLGIVEFSLGLEAFRRFDGLLPGQCLAGHGSAGQEQTCTHKQACSYNGQHFCYVLSTLASGRRPEPNIPR